MGTSQNKLQTKCNKQTSGAQEQKKPGSNSMLKHPTQNDKLLGKNA